MHHSNSSTAAEFVTEELVPDGLRLKFFFTSAACVSVAHGTTPPLTQCFSGITFCASRVDSLFRKSQKHCCMSPCWQRIFLTVLQPMIFYWSAKLSTAYMRIWKWLQWSSLCGKMKPPWNRHITNNKPSDHYFLSQRAGGAELPFRWQETSRNGGSERLSSAGAGVTTTTVWHRTGWRQQDCVFLVKEFVLFGGFTDHLLESCLVFSTELESPRHACNKYVLVSQQFLATLLHTLWVH